MIVVMRRIIEPPFVVRYKRLWEDLKDFLKFLAENLLDF
jgi:hypothetical protein